MGRAKPATVACAATRDASEGLVERFGAREARQDATRCPNLYDRPVIVQRHPAAVKAFDMVRDPEDSVIPAVLDP